MTMANLDAPMTRRRCGGRMFGDLQAGTILPVSDLERARAFQASFLADDLRAVTAQLRGRGVELVRFWPLEHCGLDVRGAEE
jgi:hypothetical protein